MNRGPQAGFRPDKSMRDKAMDAWGAEAPDWVVELAEFADKDGLKAAAARIDYSTSAVSTVINGRYNGDLARIEQMVRGALMGVMVICPVLGEIGRDRCLKHQKQPFAATSSIRVQLHRACRAGCPNARIKEDGDEVAH